MKTFILALIVSLLNSPLTGTAFSEPSMAPWGVDNALSSQQKNIFPCLQKEKNRLNLCQKTCHSMIRFFQIHISPIDGPRSSFFPTSSQYALEAIQKYGVLTGIAMGCDRLMRENGEIWVYKTTKKYGIERKLDPVR